MSVWGTTSGTYYVTVTNRTKSINSNSIEVKQNIRKIIIHGQQCYDERRHLEGYIFFQIIVYFELKGQYRKPVC